MLPEAAQRAIQRIVFIVLIGLATVHLGLESTPVRLEAWAASSPATDEPMPAVAPPTSGQEEEPASTAPPSTEGPGLEEPMQFVPSDQIPAEQAVDFPADI